MYLYRLLLNKRNKDYFVLQRNNYKIHQILTGLLKLSRKDANILFRIEEDNILVQSEKALSINEINSSLFTEIKEKEINYSNIQNGFNFKFKIKTNPIKTLSRTRKRVPLYKKEDYYSWIKEILEKNGCEILKITDKKENKLFLSKKNNHKITYFSVIFNGILKVRDKEKFIYCLSNGLGKGKAFGFGMLSIA